MSHYNVNCSVPKTLIQHLIRWVISVGSNSAPERDDAGVDPRDGDLARTGAARQGRRSTPAQSTEDKIGPYELQDFNLYYITAARLRAKQGRVPGLARLGRRTAATGRPASRPRQRRQYDLPTIKQVAGGFPVPLLPDQPVQTLGDAERPEGRLRRLAVAARRLARTVGWQRQRLARRIGTQRPEGMTLRPTP